MQKMMFGVGAVLAVVGVLAFSATPASATTSKPCWSHQDTDQFLVDGVTPNPNYLQFVAVWAKGGGHDKHLGDDNLGMTASYADCLVAFNAD